MVPLDELSKQYDIKEALSRTPEEELKIRNKMPLKYRKTYLLFGRLIRILIFTNTLVVLYIVLFKEYHLITSFFYFLALPNFVLSVIKQRMRKYARKHFL